MPKVYSKFDTFYKDSEGNDTYKPAWSEFEVDEEQADKLYEENRVEFVEEDDFAAYQDRKAKASDERVRSEPTDQSFKVATRSPGMKGNDANESNDLPAGDPNDPDDDGSLQAQEKSSKSGSKSGSKSSAKKSE